MSTADRVRRDQRRYDIAKGVFVAYLLLVQTASLVLLYNASVQSAEQQRIARGQSEQRLRSALNENERQHARTQQFVKCIAQVLVILPENRTDSDFELCGRADATTGEAQPAVRPTPLSSSPSEGTTLPTTQAPQQSGPVRNEPTTSAPPPPDDGGSSLVTDFLTAARRLLPI